MKCRLGNICSIILVVGVQSSAVNGTLREKFYLCLSGLCNSFFLSASVLIWNKKRILFFLWLDERSRVWELCEIGFVFFPLLSPLSRDNRLLWVLNTTSMPITDRLPCNLQQSLMSVIVFFYNAVAEDWQLNLLPFSTPPEPPFLSGSTLQLLMSLLSCSLTLADWLVISLRHSNKLRLERKHLGITECLRV